MATIAENVVRRFVAREFSSPEALKDYLHEHPQADRSKHTVKKPEEKAPPKEEESKGEEKKTLVEKGKGVLHGLKGKLKSMSNDAKSFLKAAPPAVHKFVTDDAHRRKVLQTAHAKMEKAPAKYVQQLVHTAKHEAKEYKEAGKALHHLMKGGKLDAQQKKVLKTVGTHMAITAAAAAFHATGVLGGAAIVGQTLAKHVALKAAKEAFGHVHTLKEIGVIGHGLVELMDKFAAEGKKVTVEEAYAALVMKKVLEELDKLDDDTIAAALEDAAKQSNQQKKEAAWKVTAAEDYAMLLDDLATAHRGIQGWVKRFPGVLRHAEHAPESPAPGRVWQEDIQPFMQEFSPMEDRLRKLYRQFNTVKSTHPQATLIMRDAVSLPYKASPDAGLGDIAFVKDLTGEQRITYSISKLQRWYKALLHWLQSSEKLISEARA